MENSFELKKGDIVYCRHQKGTVDFDFGYGRYKIKLDGDLPGTGNLKLISLGKPDELERESKKIFFPSKYVENISRIVNDEIALFIQGEKKPWEKYNPKILDHIENLWAEMCKEEKQAENLERAKRNFYMFMGELRAIQNAANSFQLNYLDPGRFNLFRFS